MDDAAATPGAAETGHNRPALSVGELSALVKRMVEGEFDHVRVRGEVSGFKRAVSGHLYFALKDEDAVLDAVCWKGTAGRLAVRPEDGMEVIATGRLTTYPGRSKYQIVVEALDHAGEGALLKLLEERRRKLAAEGLFDAARKKPLPFLPETIGVVTSPTGAVIRDILHRLADRFPRRVLVWPVLVQGQGAAEQVARAIAGFNALPPGGAVPRPDLLIVARGGGSLEDLWAFNEEIVVRAAASSRIPLIAAIGHETDTTLIDHAADRRAPTPTAAAEMAVPVRRELAADLAETGRRMATASLRAFEERRLRLQSAARALPDPGTLIGQAQQRLDDRGERLGLALMGFTRLSGQKLGRVAGGLRRATLDQLIRRGGERTAELAQRLPGTARRRFDEAGKRLAASAALLESLSYRRVLDRGFVLVTGADGDPITRAAEAKPGADVTLRFGDGEAKARIDGPGAASPPARKRPKPESDRQERLL